MVSVAKSYSSVFMWPSGIRNDAETAKNSGQFVNDMFYVDLVIEIRHSPPIKGGLGAEIHIMIPKSDWLITTFLECIQLYRLSGGEFPSFGR